MTTTVNMTQAREHLDFLLRVDVPSLFTGSYGVGKTSLVKQVCAAQGRGLVVESFATMESVDIRGLPQAGENGNVRWLRPTFVQQLWEAGPEPVLCIDEATALHPSMQVCLMQIVLDRRAGDHQLPPGTRIVLLGNRIKDRSAAQRMGRALGNRLSHYEVTVDFASWLKWAASVQLDANVVAFLSWRGEKMLNDPKPDSDEAAQQTPRSWEQAAKVASAPDGIRQGLIASQVGQGAAAEFEGFLALRRQLPPLPSILAAPDAAAVPSAPSLQYLVSIALSRAAKAGTLQAVLTYTGRVGAEFQMLAACDAVRRDATLAETGAYVHWAAANSDRLI